MYIWSRELKDFLKQIWMRSSREKNAARDDEKAQDPLFPVGDERAAREREGGERGRNPDSVGLPAQTEESGVRRDL